MRVALVLAFLLASSTLAINPAGGQTPKGPKTPAFSHRVVREKANQNLLMLLGGTLGGPYIQMAQDIARVVSDGDHLRVLPIAGDGAMKNVRDVLLLRGVDLGITTDQVLNTLKESEEYGQNLERRIAYIAPLAVDMLHVLARPEIKSVKDLAGKKMNVMPKGSASSVLVPKVLKTLGVGVEEVNLTIADALQAMRAGDVIATACFCPVPVPAYPALPADLGFALLEVPYIPVLEESFLPASIPEEAYGNLIAKGTKVQTIATSTILIAFNWAPGTERYRRIETFVNAFFSNFDKLRQPPHHPTWRNVNLAASIRGWQRFPAAQQWLDRQAAEAKAKAPPPGVDVSQARAQPPKGAPFEKAEQERLFREFMEWSRTRPKR
jgi:TRAP transporter TAXI family solute receptor